MFSLRSLGLAGAALVSLAALPTAPQDVPWHITRTIALGGDGGWDYLTFDPAGKRLFISRGQARMVQVVDLVKEPWPRRSTARPACTASHWRRT